MQQGIQNVQDAIQNHSEDKESWKCEKTANKYPKIDQILDTRNYQLSPPVPPGDKGNSYKISRKIEAPRREMNVT